LLAEQDQTRVAELVPIRYGRMAESSFAHYRGAALPMAADLATMAHTSLMVQLCGDAHLSAPTPTKTTWTTRRCRRLSRPAR
jgi:uncharacterized protein (DUF2252 family)